MAKLFPPLIEGSIPAFYTENGTVLTVPFSMNRAVSPAQVSKIILKIKTVQNNTYIDNIEAFEIQVSNIPYYAKFDLSKLTNKLKIGQFYKVQIAYIDKTNTVGYYSTVGVVKYTTKPQISIHGLESGGILNSHIYEYMGEYSQENGDITEIVHSYQFKVWDSSNELIADSGQLLHNSSEDENEYSSYDKWLLSQDLMTNKRYFIQYIVTTNSGLIVKTPHYRIMQKTSITPEIKASLNVKLNFENGYIDVDLIGTKDEYGAETPVSGAFLLSRASQETDYTVWEEMYRFKLQAQNPTRWLFRDFTIEQGKTYQYAIQQYNDNGLYSNRMLSKKIYADFEHAFLYDGEKQLKIKYNPKVTSFKPTVMEAKIDTIGSKHPFIFRNGRVYYREFPISGLISYFSDEENLFISKDELELEEKTTNLIGTNIKSERNFKMKALEWLTNGQPKIFRSPGEGNFIVRLMNCSLSPNDPTGRMLHTFNCTAYEVADFNYKELNDYGFISIEDPNVEILYWMTIDLNQAGYGALIDRPATTAKFEGLLPGTVLELTLTNGKSLEIQIGTTGAYYADFGVGISDIKIKNGSYLSGQMTYSYYTTTSNIFSTILDVQVDEIPVRQFIGEHDAFQEILFIKDKNEWVSNNKVDLIEFYNVYAEKRYVHKISEEQYKTRLEENNFDIFYLYAIGTWKPKGTQNEQAYPTSYPYRDEYFDISYYVDGQNPKKKINPSKYNPKIYINGSEVSLNEIDNFEMIYPEKLTGLSCGNGAILTCAYQTMTIDYSIEDDNGYPEVRIDRNAYNEKVAEFKNWLKQISNNNISNNEIIQKEEQFRKEIETLYTKYIITLYEAQELQKELLGLL